MNIIQTKLNYKKPLIPLDLNKVEYVIYHHIDAITAGVDEIHGWHIGFGWSGFAYNEYITKNGTVYIGRGDHIGGHCYGMNSKSYGIAVEGNYDKEHEMPDAQLKSLLERIKYNKQRFPNFKDLRPHKDFNKGTQYGTECPGKYFPYAKLNIGTTMPLLRLGANGEAVKVLQNELIKKGYDVVKVDGKFGVLTQAAIMKFQSDQKITVDGIVGPLTWGKLLGR